MLLPAGYEYLASRPMIRANGVRKSCEIELNKALRKASVSACKAASLACFANCNRSSV